MATEAEMDAAIGVLAQAIEDGVIVIDHGPVKPPYGSPERAEYDANHERNTDVH